MIRGLYTAASGLVTQQRRHDTVTNNVANLQTPGYKAVNEVSRSFPEMLLTLRATIRPRADDRPAEHGRLRGREPLDLYAGRFAGDEATGRLRAALRYPGARRYLRCDGQGPGCERQSCIPAGSFFTVQAGDEIMYTRDGRFHMNAQNELVTSDGSLVLNRNNAPIVLENEQALEFIQVNGEGQLFDIRTRTAIAGGDLLISRIDNPNDLLRAGNGRFRLQEGAARSTPVAAGDAVEIRQGVLERSNVDPAQSMVDMMTAYRAYEANQKVVQFYDRTLDKTVNEVGRV